MSELIYILFGSSVGIKYIITDGSTLSFIFDVEFAANYSNSVEKALCS